MFPAKLLVFGEYAVLSGGEAIAIPYPTFSAQWIEESVEPTAFKKYLVEFAEYLKSEKSISELIDVPQLQTDLKTGLDIQSDIPIGYGTGSSGALVAAVYHRYCKDKTVLTELIELKYFLGRMENFFHKKSSGLDPLVCYLQKPVWIQSDGSIQIIETPLPLLQNLQLYDTGISRFTQHFVEIFQERMKDEEYQKIIFEKYIPINRTTVNAVLKNDKKAFIKSLRTLSAFQLEYFTFAIPPAVREVWMHELNYGEKIMKLCGAGGGGFMLYFTES